MPAEVWTDVVSGVGRAGASAEERTDGAPLVEQATKADGGEPGPPRLAANRNKWCAMGALSVIAHEARS